MKEEVAEFAKELDVWSVPLGGVGGRIGCVVTKTKKGVKANFKFWA